MIVRMETGITPHDPRVRQVVEKATAHGLKPDTRAEQGTQYVVVEIYLLDGTSRSQSIADHVFHSLPGVAEVVRVTPPRVSIAHKNGSDPHQFTLGEKTLIGTGLPCRLIAGPCTVDYHIEEVVGALSNCGIHRIRGGCWKPRSSPYSFPGLGDKGVKLLLAAARRFNCESVCTEVIESSHIDTVRQAKRAVGYEGQIVLWVGARTSNPLLLAALGAQHDFPVMIKNTIDARGVRDLWDRADWILAGDLSFDANGRLTEEPGRLAGNNRIILCLRGTRQTDPYSPWRFIPNHHWTPILQEKSWAPVAIDPSHSAGTARLVLQNVTAALHFNPSLLMVEGGYPDGLSGPCDAEQSLSLEQIAPVQQAITRHNQERYGQAVH